MKAIRYSLFLVLTCLGFASLAQGNLNVSGVVNNANGSVPVIITVDNATFTVMTEPSGAFFFNTMVTADSGLVVVSVPCQGMLADTQSQSYDMDNLQLYFDLTYCSTNPIDDCDAYFWAWNDSISSDSITIDPFNVYIINQSSGTGISYAWDFGDGTTSTEAYPDHFYESTGEYTICLTVSSENCEDTYCLTFSVDGEGQFNGAGGAQQGFNLNVVAEMTVGLNEASTMPASLNVYPNPVQENSTLSFNSNHSYTADLQIYNVMGQMIQNVKVQITKGQNNLPLELDGLNSGNYFVRLVNEAGQATSIQVMK
jgi:PKD repeat protein